MVGVWVLDDEAKALRKGEITDAVASSLDKERAGEVIYDALCICALLSVV